MGRDLFYVETNDAVFGLDVTDEVAFSASLGEYGSSRSRQQDRGLTIEHSYHHIVKLFTDYIWWYLVALSMGSLCYLRTIMDSLSRILDVVADFYIH